MRILVTGGAGFIGSHITDRLIGHGHPVTVLDDLSTGRIENVHPAAAFRQLDVTDPQLARKLAGEHFDAIVHQAAQVSVLRSLDDPRFDAQVNLAGTMNLLAYACRAQVKRFVFASSAAVYGNPSAIPVREDAPLNPLSPYGESKLAPEEFLQNQKCSSGIQIIILRYANVYGPHQSIQGETGVVCTLIHQILSGKTPTIHGDGLQTRDFVYVGDVAEANLLALSSDAPPGVYNVGTGAATSILRLHELLAGPNRRPLHVAPRACDVRHSVLDITAIRNRLGWEPSLALPEGLSRTWRYMLNHLDGVARTPAFA